jgi:hypothetical protein
MLNLIKFIGITKQKTELRVEYPVLEFESRAIRKVHYLKQFRGAAYLSKGQKRI